MRAQNHKQANIKTNTHIWMTNKDWFVKYKTYAHSHTMESRECTTRSTRKQSNTFYSYFTQTLAHWHTLILIKTQSLTHPLTHTHPSSHTHTHVWVSKSHAPMIGNVSDVTGVQRMATCCRNWTDTRRVSCKTIFSWVFGERRNDTPAMSCKIVWIENHSPWQRTKTCATSECE